MRLKEKRETIWDLAVKAMSALDRPTNDPQFPDLDQEALGLSDSFWHDEACKKKAPSHVVYERICRYHQEYTAPDGSRNYLAPYATIVGPSGIGKSFAVKQLAFAHGIYVAYINLSPEPSRGYPRRTPLADVVDAFPKPSLAKPDVVDECVAGWKVLIVAALKDANICWTKGISPREHFKLQTISRSYSEKLSEDVSTLLPTMHTHYLRDWTRFEDSRRESDHHPKSTQTTPEKRHKGKANEDQTCKSVLEASDSGLAVVFCIDEARNLLKNRDQYGTPYMFRAFRRAMTAVCQDNKAPGLTDRCFALMLDTTSKVTNFMPTAEHDPSQRWNPQDPNPHASKLFYPIYGIVTFDSLADNRSEYRGLNDTLDSVCSMLKLGRPLWASTLENMRNAYFPASEMLTDTEKRFLLGKLVKFAGYKLGPTDSENCDPHLVLLSQRINLNISECDLAEHLVARCMRQILYINQSRTFVSTIAASEPILSLAASWYMRKPDKKLACLKALLPHFFQGSINIGDSGEFVAALTLLFTMDSMQDPVGWMPKRVKVRDFFEALLGNYSLEVADQIKLNKSLQKTWDDGWIYFNHFFRPSTPSWAKSTYPPDMVNEAYRRGAALFFPQGFPGADIGIPVKFDGDDACTLLLVQVKNEEEGFIGNGCRETAKKALKDVSDKLPDLGPCFFIWMSLYPKKYKRKEPEVRESLLFKPPRATDDDPPSLILIIVGLDSTLYPSVGTQADNPNKDLQETIFEHLTQLRDALPMSRFSDTMEEKEQAEDLLGHLAVWDIPKSGDQVSEPNEVEDDEPHPKNKFDEAVQILRDISPDLSRASQAVMSYVATHFEGSSQSFHTSQSPETCFQSAQLDEDSQMVDSM